MAESSFENFGQDLTRTKDGQIGKAMQKAQAEFIIC